MASYSKLAQILDIMTKSYLTLARAGPFDAVVLTRNLVNLPAHDPTLKSILLKMVHTESGSYTLLVAH